MACMRILVQNIKVPCGNLEKLQALVSNCGGVRVALDWDDSDTESE